MATHTLGPDRASLHGHFSRDLRPALSVDSGDTVVFQTLDAGWNLEPHTAPGVRSRAFEPRDPELDAGHALCGPVEVRGAHAGHTLEVEVVAVEPGSWGWSSAGGVPNDVNVRLGVGDEPRAWMLWHLNREEMTGRNQHGHTVRLRPFMGVMGMPPGEPGIHATTPPRTCGGNIDCKELVAGTRLFLPIAVPGALFSAGDGHAAQGDGEVSTLAIECPIARAELVLRVHDDIQIITPRARTPNGWLTFGFHADLDEAAHLAVEAMLDLICELHGTSRREALALASVAVDLRVTQIVNRVRGVHAVLPDGAITG